jgi:hypothetical protein
VVEILPSSWGLAHRSLVFDRKEGRAIGESLAMCAHVRTLCSHKGVSLRRIRFNLM